MKPDRIPTSPLRPEGSTAPVARRTLVVGAGVAGAAAVAATVLQGHGVPVPDAVGGGTETVEPGGYRLSAHVLRYYETTKA